MKSHKFVLLSLLFFLGNPLFAEKFCFNFTAGSKQSIEALVSGKQFINKKFANDYTEYFKTIRTVKKVRDDSGIIEDINYYYNQNKSEKNKIREIKTSTEVNYAKDKLGYLTVYDNAFFPTLRDVPVFPDGELEPGFKWTAAGTEIQDIFNDKIISIFPIVVNYTFIGYETLNDRKLAKFRYEYSIKLKNNGKINIDRRILQLECISSTIMYFDNGLGTQVREEYNRNYSFLIKNGSEKFTLELLDSGTRIWHPIELMDKSNIMETIKKEIEEEKIENTEVAQDEKGIKIRIDDILFLPDSTALIPGENSCLTKIAEILSRYKGREILIVGHTALAGTKASQQELSVKRAQTIADCLIKQNAIDPEKTSISGKGADEPIADNSTEEGKRRNRRVEIYILEE